MILLMFSFSEDILILYPRRFEYNVHLWNTDLLSSFRISFLSLSKNVVRPPGGSLILESDVDEIPARHTVALLKACKAPLPLHLQLRNFVYSFEFPTDMRSWRAQVHEWNLDGSTPYMHGKAGQYVLTDSGWHCRWVKSREETREIECSRERM